MTHECECGNPKPKRAQGCATCLARERAWRQAERPSTQALTLLRRRGEWLLAAEVADALEEPIERVSWNLAYLVERGLVESKRGDGGVVYRTK